MSGERQNRPRPAKNTTTPSDIGLREYWNGPEVARLRGARRSPRCSRIPRVANEAAVANTAIAPAQINTAPGMRSHAGNERRNKWSQRRRYKTSHAARSTTPTTRIRVQAMSRCSRDMELMSLVIEIQPNENRVGRGHPRRSIYPINMPPFTFSTCPVI